MHIPPKLSKWYNERISNKLLSITILGTVVVWAIICSIFIVSSEWQPYANKLSQLMANVSTLSLEASSILEEKDGDITPLIEYFDQPQYQGMCFTVVNNQGDFVDNSPQIKKGDPVWVFGGTIREIILRDGQELNLTIWIHEKKLAHPITRLNALMIGGISIILLGLSLLILSAIHIILKRPLNQLRETIDHYAQFGTLPKPSTRRDELGRLQNTFYELTQKQQKNEQEKIQMIAAISHDLKTPLTSLVGCSERILTAQLTEEKRELYTRIMRDKALVISGIVDDFDCYLDNECNYKDSEKKITTLGAFSKQLHIDYTDELLDAGIVFKVHCKDSKSKFQCDYENMRRCLGNLISNSISHSKSDRLELSFTCKQENDSVIFVFTDNGKGVHPESLPQIFQPFYTSDSGRKVSGLGLSICKNIITAHGGTIWAYNLPKGFSIKIVLPCVA